MCMYIQQHQRVEISTYSLIKPKEFLYILRDIKQWAELYICMYILKHIHTLHLYLSMVNFSFCTKGVQLKLRKSFQVTGAKQKGAERLCHSATRSEGLDRRIGPCSGCWLQAADCVLVLRSPSLAWPCQPPPSAPLWDCGCCRTPHRNRTKLQRRTRWHPPHDGSQGAAEDVWGRGSRNHSRWTLALPFRVDQQFQPLLPDAGVK